MWWKSLKRRLAEMGRNESETDAQSVARFRRGAAVPGKATNGAAYSVPIVMVLTAAVRPVLGEAAALVDFRCKNSRVVGALLLRRPPEELPLHFRDEVGILEARLVQSLLHALPVHGLVEPVKVVVTEILRHPYENKYGSMAQEKKKTWLTTRKSAGRGAAGRFMRIAYRPVFLTLFQ